MTPQVLKPTMTVISKVLLDNNFDVFLESN